MRFRLPPLVWPLLAACGGGDASPVSPSNKPPIAALAAEGTVVAGQPLVFDGTMSADPDGDPLRFSWSFGDGGRGGTAKLAHVFATAGTFAVTLTVADGRGGVDEIARDVTVAAAPPPVAMVTATVRVSSPTGDVIAGASVQILGGASATTDAGGLATLAVGAGATQVLRVDRAGFTRQTQALELPAANAFVDVVLYPLAETLVLGDATAGGALAGADGARVDLPAAALVDEAGRPVSGAVDVMMTPLDVVAAGAAFPGKFEGVAPDGTTGLIMSWGTVSFSFTQDGRELNLAPGQAATVELPVYAGRRLDGTPVREGDGFPLWSLDERTGMWIQEGQGTVVASAGSPTGFALRGEVGHFSWWNCDAFTTSHKTGTRCCIDSNFDGECDGDTICYVRGRTDCPSAACNVAKAGERSSSVAAADEAAAAPPAFSASTVIAAGATSSLAMPATWPVYLEGFADNGTQYGYAVVSPTTDAVTLVLRPSEQALPTQMITLPWDMNYTSGPPGTFARFTFDAAAGAVVIVSVGALGSTLEGTVSLKSPSGAALRTGTFSQTAGGFTATLPVTGRYTVEVNPTKNEPGGYQLEARLVTDQLVVTGRSPAPGASGVALDSPITVTFSRDVRPGSVNAGSFRVVGPAGDVTGTRSIAGNVATFTPAAPLAPGIPHTVMLSTLIHADAAPFAPLAVAEEWTFQAVEVIGALMPLTAPGGGGVAATAAADDESFFVLVQTGPGIVAHRYVPGVGFLPPSLLDAPVFTTGGYFVGGEALVAAAGPGLATAVWRRQSTGMIRLFASHYAPASGWSAPEDIVDLPADPRTVRLAVDAQGRAIVTWAGNAPDPIHIRRWTGTWSAPVTIPTVSFYHSLAMNAAGDAAIGLAPDTTREAVSRFDAQTGSWSPPETVGGYLAGNSRLGMDEAGNIFVLGYTPPPAKAQVRRWSVAEGTWGPVKDVGSGASSLGLTVSKTGTAVVTGAFAQPDGAGATVWAQEGDGTSFGPVQTLEIDNHGPAALALADGAGNFDGLSMDGSTIEGRLDVRDRRFENGAWAQGEPVEYSGLPVDFAKGVALSPHGKLLFVGGSQSGVFAIRFR